MDLGFTGMPGNGRNEEVEFEFIVAGMHIGNRGVNFLVRIDYFDTLLRWINSCCDWSIAGK